MPQRLRINIPEPCHEDWNAMTPSQQGRHCASCNKIVMDFTAMSDAQIIAYFQTATNKTCGRFYNSQLNRDFYLYTTSAGKRMRIKYIAVSMFLAQLFTYRSYAKADMVDTSIVNIDSCREVAADTAKVDSSSLVWQADTNKAQVEPIDLTCIVVCEMTYGWTSVTVGDACISSSVTEQNVLPGFLNTDTEYLKNAVADYLYTGNKVRQSKHGKESAPPTKPRQWLNWLASLPKRLRIEDNEIDI